jgi:hypothetical protein
MIRQNRASILQFIVHLEQQHSVNDWCVQNIRLWPMIRIKLFFNLIFAIEKHVQESTSPSLSAFQKVLVYIESFCYRALLSFRLMKLDTLYAGFFAHRVMFQGSAFNRFFDPLMDDDEKEDRQSMILEYARPQTPKQNYKAQRVIEAYKLFPAFSLGREKNLINFRDAIEAMIAEANERFGTDIKALNFIRSIESDASRMFVNERLFDFLLDKLQPEKVVGLTYYNPAMMGLILACKKRNIPIADMQHGPQGALHASYADWTSVPTEGYELLPDEFYCWNDRDAGEINNSIFDRGILAHRAVNFGNPWTAFWKNPARPSSFASWPERLILYTLQPVEGMLEPYLINAIRQTQHEYAWWFRLHPRQIAKDKAILVETLQNARLEKVVNIDDASALPLPDILRHTTVHITKYSGCFLEAMEFEVPSVIIDERGVSIFSEHLQSGRVMVNLAHDTDELLQTIHELQLKLK